MMEQQKQFPFHILSIGPFGKAVGERLKVHCPNSYETIVVGDVLPIPEAWPMSRASVLISWRPAPHICQLLNQVSHEWERPFVPCIVNSTILRFGPVVVPGHGGCWDCWERRSGQRRDVTDDRSALLRHYESHPDEGPQGYFPPFATMAAARIAQIIDALDASTAVPGHIWQIDMITRQIVTGTMVGLHGCPQCGLHRDAHTRSFLEMRRDLEYLWAAGGPFGDTSRDA
jgi:bacteriocin biosynthesis cyclodehydratase domain-containing protein